MKLHKELEEMDKIENDLFHYLCLGTIILFNSLILFFLYHFLK